jgi:hypothetical protein
MLGDRFLAPVTHPHDSTNFVRIRAAIRETERDSDNSVNQRAGFDNDLSWSETSDWLLQICSVAPFCNWTKSNI